MGRRGRNAQRRLGELNSELVNLVALLLGAALILWAVLIGYSKPTGTVLLSVGGSVVASAVFAFLSSHYLERQARVRDVVNYWKIEAVYRTRAEMNADSNQALADCSQTLDLIAFGLKSFRETQTDLVTKKVGQGLKVRILAPEVDSPFVAQRERDEREVEGQIRQTIVDLDVWVQQLRAASPSPDNVRIKHYRTMPLDFYFRIDRSVFIGPYLPGLSSQQTISYQFVAGGEGFEYWTKYFDRLWNDPEFSQELVDEQVSTTPSSATAVES